MILLIEDMIYNLLADLLALTKESYQPPLSLECPWDGLLTCCCSFGSGICLMVLWTHLQFAVMKVHALWRWILARPFLEQSGSRARYALSSLERPNFWSYREHSYCRTIEVFSCSLWDQFREEEIESMWSQLQWWPLVDILLRYLILLQWFASLSSKKCSLLLSRHNRLWCFVWSEDNLSN